MKNYYLPALCLFCTTLGLLAPLGGDATSVKPGDPPKAKGERYEPFEFESVSSLDEMKHFLEMRFPLESPRDALRKVFISEGRATLIAHPSQARVEKYLYDINLCNYYIWRWNISADYDPSGHLLQSYVNGEPVFIAGKQKKDGRALGNSGHASIYKMKRARPEATLGEKELSFILIDADSDPKTIDDQVLTGGGPTRTSIATPGRLHLYSDVEPWRSIFDFDSADHIAAYAGDCSTEVAQAKRSSAAPR